MSNPILDYEEMKLAYAMKCFELVRLRAEVEALREALTKYGHHTDKCTWYFDQETNPCICGFAALAAKEEV